MKKINFDFENSIEKWKDFLISKGFHVFYEEIRKNNRDHFISFKGCNPIIRIEIYAGNFRTDTNTGGCICMDFDKCWNKVSSCPFYADLTIKESVLWECVELLMNAGFAWANTGGELKYCGGSWSCYPSINEGHRPKCIK